MKQPHKGTALITALFMVAIVVIIAMAFIMRGRHLITHEMWASRSDKVVLALQGVQDWGISVIEHAPIIDAGVLFSPDVENMPSMSYQGIEVKAVIKDQQGLFNVNNLVRSRQQSHFVRLLKAIDPSISTRQAYGIAVAITAKLSAEKATQRQMIDISELRTISAIPRSLYEKLKPYLTAMPANGATTPINVNTAPAPIIYSLSPTMTLSQAKAAATCVQKQGVFENMIDYNHACLQPLKITNLQNTTMASRFFMIDAQVKKGPEKRTLHVFLQVGIAHQKPSVKIIWRTLT